MSLIVQCIMAMIFRTAQVKARPPTFALFTSRPVPESYKKFLQSNLRTEFELGGIPVRLLVREKVNPFTAGGGDVVRVSKSKNTVSLSSIPSTGYGENKAIPSSTSREEGHSESQQSSKRERRKTRKQTSALFDRSLDRKHAKAVKAVRLKKRLNARPSKRALSRKR